VLEEASAAGPDLELDPALVEAVADSIEMTHDELRAAYEAQINAERRNRTPKPLLPKPPSPKPSPPRRRFSLIRFAIVVALAWGLWQFAAAQYLALLRAAVRSLAFGGADDKSAILPMTQQCAVTYNGVFSTPFSPPPASG
jgi:hypothetical protein